MNGKDGEEGAAGPAGPAVSIQLFVASDLTSCLLMIYMFFGFSSGSYRKKRRARTTGTAWFPGTQLPKIIQRILIHLEIFIFNVISIKANMFGDYQGLPGTPGPPGESGKPGVEVRQQNNLFSEIIVK